MTRIQMFLFIVLQEYMEGDERTDWHLQLVRDREWWDWLLDIVNWLAVKIVNKYGCDIRDDVLYDEAKACMHNYLWQFF